MGTVDADPKFRPTAAAADRAPQQRLRARQAYITVRGLQKDFQGTTIYDDFSIDLPMGKFISIFGPNGCGKSTLINMISGLMPMDAGEVLYDGQTIRDTKISYVFQNYREALFPWTRAIDNIHYPLKVLGVAAQGACRRRVEKLLGRLRRSIRSERLSVHPVGWPAADGFDPAGAGHRTGSAVPRRAFLRARLRNDVVHARAPAKDVHEDAGPRRCWSRTIWKRRSSWLIRSCS